MYKVGYTISLQIVSFELLSSAFVKIAYVTICVKYLHATVCCRSLINQRCVNVSSYSMHALFVLPYSLSVRLK